MLWERGIGLKMSVGRDYYEVVVAWAENVGYGVGWGSSWCDEYSVV